VAQGNDGVWAITRLIGCTANACHQSCAIVGACSCPISVSSDSYLAHDRRLILLPSSPSSPQLVLISHTQHSHITATLDHQGISPHPAVHHVNSDDSMVVIAPSDFWSNLVDKVPSKLPPVKSILLGGSQVILGAQSFFGGLDIGNAPSCSNPQLSCHNTSIVEDLCCFNYPGGQMLQTQFWDTNPPTGPDDAWTIHGLW
jgi:hypothetical protein